MQTNEKQVDEAFRQGLNQLKVITRSWKKKQMDPLSAHRGHARSSLLCLAACIHSDTDCVDTTIETLAEIVNNDVPMIRALLEKTDEKG